MQISKWVAIAVTTTMLTACTESDGSPGRGVMQGGSLNKTDVGTAAGAIGGGIIGYQFGGGAGQALATVGGALLGGMLGSSVGNSLDRADMLSYDQASQSAMETGKSRRWSNNGRSGTIHPHKRYRDDFGRYCREYSQTILIDGRKHQGHGTACRNEDGTWRIAE